MNSSLSFSLETNESEAFDLYAPRRRLLGVQDRVADAMAQAKAMHKNFIQEASVYLSFTFETSGHQSEWMNTWPSKVRTQVLSDGSCTPTVNVIKAMGFALGMTVNCAAMVAQSFGWDYIPQLTVDAGLFYNRNTGAEAAAMALKVADRLMEMERADRMKVSRPEASAGRIEQLE